MNVLTKPAHRASATMICATIVVVGGLLGQAGEALAQSAYLPDKGELETSVGTIYQDYNSAWQGKDFQEYPRTTTIQEYRLNLAYGITDTLSLDLSTGYGTLVGGLQRGARPNPNGCWNQPLNVFAGRQCQDPIPQGSRDGVLDSRVGLRWQAYQEDSSVWNSLPTVALYGNGIIAGDYENTPQALGDGANGAEFGVFLGRYWDNFKFGLLGNLEYQYLRGPQDVVPNNWNGSISAYKFFGPFFVNGAYAFQYSLSGWDTGQGPYPANPQNLPANLVGPPDSRDYNRMLNAVGRQENWESWELGGGYLTEGGTVIYGSYSDVFDGRNTADRQTWLLVVTVPTQLFGREW